MSASKHSNEIVRTKIQQVNTDKHGLVNVSTPAVFHKDRSLYQSIEIAPTNAASIGNRVQYRVSRGIVAMITDAFLAFDLEESGGLNAVTLPTTSGLIEFVEISMNGSNLFQQKYTSLDMYLLTGLKSKEEFDLNRTYDNMDSTYASVSLAASEKRVLYLDLSHSILNHINAELLDNSDVIVSVKFSPMVTGGTGTLQLNSVNLNLSYMGEHPDDALSRKYADMHLNSSGLIYKFLYPVHTSHSQTLSASSTVDLLLSGLNGPVYAIFVTVKQSNAFVDSEVFEDLSDIKFDLLDSSKRSLIGSQQTTKQLNYKLAKHHAKGNVNELFFRKGIPVISLTEDLISDTFRHTSHGEYDMDGNSYLRMVFDSTWTTGTYFVDIVAWTNGIMHHKTNGKFERLD